MQVVIDIPDDMIPTKQEIVDTYIHFIDGTVCEVGGYAFTVLPKGHSRLIEEDAALDVLRRSGYLAPEALWYYKNVFKDVKTIIPADKENK